ncbi:type II 3-dehydroquinate dehydratase [Pontivivens insulae]|uniref:3-dehydroquinate dehydratase n=1 Tax=Pontivivens insulae TaxID=1639689 RepID=A0A2R8A9E4_9RHOB|nr:type II 3-dehydroquinate dehydratase [Pontivivens insulae]RED12753.1 3-dehydroquinate dehydratase [Pontivivens insulae]SPF28844.1 3-dehydroquinate dehydratase [Pontivivens insulae]
MTTKIHILNGPNLNLLGERQPEIYGHDTLADIEARAQAQCDALGMELTFAQTNSEGGLVDLIQAARAQKAAIIINAGAYTHTSVAVLDALSACDGLFIVELHLSSPHRREAFRHKSYVALAADAVIAGFGADGYRLAVEAVAARVAR